MDANYSLSLLKSDTVRDLLENMDQTVKVSIKLKDEYGILVKSSEHPNNVMLLENKYKYDLISLLEDSDMKILFMKLFEDIEVFYRKNSEYIICDRPGCDLFNEYSYNDLFILDKGAGGLQSLNCVHQNVVLKKCFALNIDDEIIKKCLSTFLRNMLKMEKSNILIPLKLSTVVREIIFHDLFYEQYKSEAIDDNDRSILVKQLVSLLLDQNSYKNLSDEGATVKKDLSLREQRTVSFKDCKKAIHYHMYLTNGKRAYFFIEDTKLLVGYFGKHLKTKKYK